MTRHEHFYVGVDFDGTCAGQDVYPQIGMEVPHCIDVLKRIQDAGHKIILSTMRSGAALEIAVKWLDQRGIKLFGINTNPTQRDWTDSPKPYVNVYIGDECLGCPLSYDPDVSLRPFVDWKKVESRLWKAGVFDLPAHELYPFPKFMKELYTENLKPL